MRIIDLFSGAGGLTFGFYYRVRNNCFVRNRKNSFVFANEFDSHAAKAFSMNFPDIKMINQDIKSLDKNKIKALVGDEPVDLIIGGPPCQSFSTVGQRIYDEKATMYEEYLRILGIVKPKMFLFENVKGILSMRETFYKKDEYGNVQYDITENKETHKKRKKPIILGQGRKVMDIIEEKFANINDELGYTISKKVLNAVDFGVPENRERVFIVGIRNDIKIEWDFPEVLKTSKISIKEAISDLPSVRESETVTEYSVEPQNAYQKLMRGNSKKVTSHFLWTIWRKNTHSYQKCKARARKRRF